MNSLGEPIHIYLAHLYAELAGAAPDSYGRI
jgi:hypothetical protein